MVKPQAFKPGLKIDSATPQPQWWHLRPLCDPHCFIINVNINGSTSLGHGLRVSEIRNIRFYPLPGPLEALSGGYYSDVSTTLQKHYLMLVDGLFSFLQWLLWKTSPALSAPPPSMLCSHTLPPSNLCRQGPGQECIISYCIVVGVLNIVCHL
jgi:hypothetical protein